MRSIAGIFHGIDSIVTISSTSLTVGCNWPNRGRLLTERRCVWVFQNEAAFDEIFQQANFNTFVFRNRVKLETYNVSKASLLVALLSRRQACNITPMTQKSASMLHLERSPPFSGTEWEIYFFLTLSRPFLFINAAAYSLTPPTFWPCRRKKKIIMVNLQNGRQKISR